MTRRKASYLQGTDAARYLLPAEDHRLNRAGLWAPSSMPGAAALAVASGVVFGPGNPGNVTVVAGGVNVSPFHAAVQGGRTGVQGVFELTSDATEFRAITAASSTQYRRGRLGIRVYDQANGSAKDDWDIEVLYGPNAASAGAATLPAIPTDSTWFELRQFAVSNTGAITLAGTTPRTGPRGGIVPVEAGDVTPGAMAGQYRDHPAGGLERWNGNAWVPAPAGRAPVNASLVGMGVLAGARPPHTWREGRTVHLAGTGYLNGTAAQTGGRLLLFTVAEEFRTPASGGYLVLPNAVINGWLGASLEVHPDGRVVLRNDGANGGYSGNGTAGSFAALNAFWSVD